jgi:hypothetical protein
MAIKVTIRKLVKSDISSLPSRRLRLEVVGYLVRLKDEPYLGRPLGKHPVVGDLSDCRKIFFDNACYRILYRLLPNEKNPTEADVIAVGPRAALSVYKAAAKRLGQ